MTKQARMDEMLNSAGYQSDKKGRYNVDICYMGGRERVIKTPINFGARVEELIAEHGIVAFKDKGCDAWLTLQGE